MHEPDPKDDDLLEELERRAYSELPEDEEDAVDIVAELREQPEDEPADDAKDLTLGGYRELHGRAPAFTGSDDQPYTVDVDVEPTDDPDRPWVVFLVFLRWAATGAGIMDHVESGDIAFGATEKEARRNADELSLFEVKAELDAAIERKRKETGG